MKYLDKNLFVHETKTETLIEVNIQDLETISYTLYQALA